MNLDVLCVQTFLQRIPHKYKDDSNMKKIINRVFIIIMLTNTFGCANSNLPKSIAAGVEQTVKTQQKADRQDIHGGNERSNKIEKESIINGFIAFSYCLFSSSKKCE